MQIAVRDWLCVPLPNATQYSVHGNTLVYTDTASTLQVMDLTPLLHTPLLRAAATPHRASVPWVNDGSDTQPFTPTLKGIVGRRLVAVALEETSLGVVGLAEYDCARCEWSVSVQLPEDITTLPLVTNQAIVVGECMYACLGGRLLSVPLSTPSTNSPTPTTMYPLSLSDQPQYDRDSQHVVLPTAAGDRRLRVSSPLPLLGDSPMVPSVGGRTAAGDCVGGACVKGVVSGDHGCYTVSGGVWLPMSAGSRRAIDVTSGNK
ncbi:hypothetical protein KIPB_014265, partial [Kipferlia bialata]|eukprot:g14265.t1